MKKEWRFLTVDDHAFQRAMLPSCDRAFRTLQQPFSLRQPPSATQRATEDAALARYAPAEYQAMGLFNAHVINAIAVASDATPDAILRDFQESTGDDLASLRFAARAGAMEVVALHAHRICGARQMLGAGTLAHLSRLLQAAASRGEVPAVAALLESNAR